jgi:hypothetical protein
MKTILAVIGGITVVAVILLAIGVGIAAIGSRAAPVATSRPVAVTIVSKPAQPVALAIEPTLAPPSTATPNADIGVRMAVTTLYDPCETSSIYEPVAGRRPVGVEVALFNDTNSGKLAVNPLYFTLIGTDGLPYEPSLGTCDRQIDLPDLVAGESVRGVVSFNLPPDVKAKAIRFKTYGMNTFLEAAIP